MEQLMPERSEMFPIRVFRFTEQHVKDPTDKRYILRGEASRILGLGRTVLYSLSTTTTEILFDSQSSGDYVKARIADRDASVNLFSEKCLELIAKSRGVDFNLDRSLEGLSWCEAEPNSFTITEYRHKTLVENSEILIAYVHDGVMYLSSNSLQRTTQRAMLGLIESIQDATRVFKQGGKRRRGIDIERIPEIVPGFDPKTFAEGRKLLVVQNGFYET